MSTPKKEYKGGYRQINKALNICAFEDYLEAQTSNLPEIADVEQISPRVLRVLGQNAGKVSHGSWSTDDPLMITCKNKLTISLLIPLVHSPRHQHIHRRNRT